MRVAKRSNAFNRLYVKNYNFNYITCLINVFLRKGFKLHSINIISRFLYLIKLKYNRNIVTLLNLVFNKYVPLFSFLTKKIAANTYSLPWLIRESRGKTLIVRWFLKASLARTENSVLARLLNEFDDLKLGYGLTTKMLEDHYNLALKNRPFLRFLRKRRKVFLSRLKKFGVK